MDSGITNYVVMGLWIAASLGIGSIIGALVSSGVARRMKRTEMTLKIVEDYLSRFNELREVVELLQSPLNIDKDGANKVIKIGNWFEVVATLYGKKAVIDRQLIKDVGLDKRISSFRDRIISPENPFSKYLNDNSWRALKRFST